MRGPYVNIITELRITLSFQAEITKKQLPILPPDEAIQGINFFSAQVDSFPYHEWPKATSDMKMNQRVLRKS